MYYGEENSFDDRYREFVIKYIKENNINISNRHNYQFGIYSGNTFIHIYRLFLKYNLIPEKIWGADSFIGLPEEEKNVDKNPIWVKNEFSSQYLFGTNNNNEIINAIMNRIKDEDRKIDYEFIEGYFNESLNNNFLKKNPKPAFWIDVDVDLFVSTMDLLDFMFKNKLIVKGTILSYDDWDGINFWNGGECLAHYKMAEKYKVNFEKIRVSHDTQIFIVESIGYNYDN
jgi:hypothetical protein